MENLFWLIPALACPLGMLLMMWVMGKGMGHRKGKASERSATSELRAENAHLTDRLESLERERAN